MNNKSGEFDCDSVKSGNILVENDLNERIVQKTKYHLDKLFKKKMRMERKRESHLKNVKHLNKKISKACLNIKKLQKKLKSYEEIESKLEKMKEKKSRKRSEAQNKTLDKEISARFDDIFNFIQTLK